MKLSDFDYFLPEELIAQDPIERRDESRLMVVDKDKKEIEHRVFKDLVEYLNPKDTLVINDTKVIPARLIGKKEGTGAQIEVLLLNRLAGNRWEALVKPGRRVPVGARISFGGGLMECTVMDTTRFGGRVVDFRFDGSFEEVLDRAGVMPLPPYIKKPLTDNHRYQTIYARQAGSAAAPTAGLHFTRELMEKIKGKGVTVTSVLLHVGLGTFRTVKVEDISKHHMHAEYYEITGEAANAIAETKERGGRVFAVGTTTTRCLESAAEENGNLRAGAG
ncbi:MAG: tRNA preQ1(34) S-adenosylmethionine ribosyltransferase-isomerase QueA, partial [Firmicutes bacterium]|nr:tRNA preQ1(34) S-adenosylmethionine ribosyltransferase-isomerase QueA [Bacillota bacterium]